MGHGYDSYIYLVFGCKIRKSRGFINQKLKRAKGQKSQSMSESSDMLSAAILHWPDTFSFCFLKLSRPSPDSWN